MVQGPRRGVLAWLTAAILCGGPSIAAAQPAGAVPTVRVALDEPLAGAPRLAVTPAFPTAVRIIIDVEPLLDDRRAATLDRLEGRLRAHEARSTPVWLVISTPVPGVDRMEAWGQALQSLASRAGTRVSWYEIALMPAA